MTKVLDKIPSTNTGAYKARDGAAAGMQDLPATALVQRHVGHVQHEVLVELAGRRGREYTPASWRNYWQMTSIDMLTHLKPAVRA